MRGKVLPYMPAFQPYRGKPAVRNDRGDDGNVGIIRSPLRAIVLPDRGGVTFPGDPVEGSYSIMANLYGHTAGNGGHGQGDPTVLFDSSLLGRIAPALDSLNGRSARLERRWKSVLSRKLG